MIRRFCGNVRLFYLDVSDQLKRWCFDRSLAVYDSLNGGCPSHGLIQHLGIETVRMLPPVHNDIPVT